MHQWYKLNSGQQKSSYIVGKMFYLGLKTYCNVYKTGYNEIICEFANFPQNPDLNFYLPTDFFYNRIWFLSIIIHSVCHCLFGYSYHSEIKYVVSTVIFFWSWFFKNNISKVF